MELTPEKKARLRRIAPLGGHARAADLGSEGCRRVGLQAFEKHLNADGKGRERASEFRRKRWAMMDAEAKAALRKSQIAVRTLNYQRKAAGLKPVYGKKAQAMLKQLASYRANKALRKAAASANAKTTEAA
jgi:hypothetical protein